MKNKKLISVLLALFAVTVLMHSCVDDEFDTPETSPLPIGDVITIAQMKALYPNNDYSFSFDMTVYATVTMDDKSGNIYKTAYIQDATGAIALHLDAAGGIYQGDSIRLQLNGLKIGKYRELFQIDALDGNGFTLDNYTTKIQTLVNVEPVLTTIEDINNNKALYQCKLVKLEGIQFVAGDTAATYADAAGQITENREIEDSLENIMIVRTSGYANFADENVPNGKGYLVAIVGQYDDDMQLYIRSTEEVLMNEERYISPEILSEDFNSGLGDFIQYSLTGTNVWEYSSSYKCAVVNGYPNDNEDWLFTPELDLTSFTSATMSFRYALGYLYDEIFEDISVQVSSDYSGTGNPDSATWVEKSFTQASLAEWWEWTNSGDIDLSEFAGESSVYVAFKYISTSSRSCAWEVDNVKVVAQ